MKKKIFYRPTYPIFSRTVTGNKQLISFFRPEWFTGMTPSMYIGAVKGVLLKMAGAGMMTLISVNRGNSLKADQVGLI